MNSNNTTVPAGAQASQRHAALNALRKWIPPLIRVIFYTSTPPRLVMEVESLRGGIEQIDLGTRPPNPLTIRWLVLAATGYLPPPVAKDAWEKVLKLLAAAMEITEAPETDEWGALVDIVMRYVESRRPVDENDKTAFMAAHRYDEPLVYKGNVCINAAALSTWARGRGVMYTPREMALLLRRYGAEAITITVRDGGSVRTRRYWALPASMLPEAIKEEESFTESKCNHVIGSPEQVITGENAVRDDENAGCNHVITSPPQEEAATSDYMITPAENAVWDGAKSVIRSPGTSDYMITSRQEAENLDLEWEVL